MSEYPWRDKDHRLKVMEEAQGVVVKELKSTLKASFDPTLRASFDMFSEVSIQGSDITNCGAVFRYDYVAKEMKLVGVCDEYTTQDHQALWGIVAGILTAYFRLDEAKSEITKGVSND